VIHRCLHLHDVTGRVVLANDRTFERLGAAVALTLERFGKSDSSAGPPVARAEELYTRGRLLLDGWTPGGVRTALGLFEQVALDPAHASAHAGIAQAYLQRPAQIVGIQPSIALAR
jgi:hypothetical protein